MAGRKRNYYLWLELLYSTVSWLRVVPDCWQAAGTTRLGRTYATEQPRQAVSEHPATLPAWEARQFGTHEVLPGETFAAVRPAGTYCWWETSWGGTCAARCQALSPGSVRMPVAHATPDCRWCGCRRCGSRLARTANQRPHTRLPAGSLVTALRKPCMLLEMQAATLTEVCRNLKLADDGLEVCRRAADDGQWSWGVGFIYSSPFFFIYLSTSTASPASPRFAQVAETPLWLILPHFVHWWTCNPLPFSASWFRVWSYGARRCQGGYPHWRFFGQGMYSGAKFLQCWFKLPRCGRWSLIVCHTNSVVCKVMLVVALLIESFD